MEAINMWYVSTGLRLVLVVLFLDARLCPTLCDPTDCRSPGSSVHGDSPGEKTRRGCHILFQGIFPSQGSNPGLPHCRQILYRLSYQGSPKKLVVQSCLTLCDPIDWGPPGSPVPGILQARILKWVAILFSRGIFPT